MSVSRAVSTDACFHCGLPLSGADIHAPIDGEERPFCCAGCRAVAEVIAGAGLTRFYQHRDAVPGQPPQAVDEDLAAYDHPAVQERFVRERADGLREADLLLEGLVCGACVWLLERHVGALDGVAQFQINYSTQRAHLAWDPARAPISRILSAVREVGYQAYPYDPDRGEQLRRRERARALRRLAVAGVGMMQVMMVAVALWLGEHNGMSQSMVTFLRWTCLLITTPVLVYAGQPFFANALRDLRRGTLGMDVPVAIALLTTYASSVLATVVGGPVYFESVVMFLAFLLAGRFLEQGARHRSGEAMEALARLQPALARRLGPEGESMVPSASLVSGDRVRVLPGESMPADGMVISGRSAVDEALISGESLPRSKVAGDAVAAGTVNRESPLEIQVTGVGPESTLGTIARLLARAQSARPAMTQRFERGTGWFTGLVLLLAAASAAVWGLWLDPARALPVAIAVLVVSCPCALALATPAALTAATGRLTRLGILVVGADALERLARVTRVVFDKTGTVTVGAPEVVGVDTLADVPLGRCQSIAAALARHSEHPMSRAIAAMTAGPLPPASEVESVPGEGVRGRVADRVYAIGRRRFVAPGAHAIEPEGGESAVWLGDGRRLLARLRLFDRPRADAERTIQRLRRRGLPVTVLSGDRPGAVAAVARVLGIDDARAGLRPADKLDALTACQAAGERVLAVGDGVNDAPLLAAADVSVAVAGATDLARASADLVLNSAELARVVDAWDTARETRTVIRQNLAWALGYNLIALPLAAAGLITPWLAALGMSLSSLLVVLNALRLRQ